MGFYVYQHVRLDTNTPFYVGKGKRGTNRSKSKRSRNDYWHNIVKKHGYTIEIIEENLTENQAFQKEIELIALYKSQGYCEANIASGGLGRAGCKPWNKGKTGLQKHTAKSKAKLSKAFKGKNPWNSGKTGIFSEKVLERKRQSMIGKNAGKNSGNWKGFVISPFGKFESTRDAARNIGLSRPTIINRINSKSYPDWYYSKEL